MFGQNNNQQGHNQQQARPLSAERKREMLCEAYSYHVIRPKLHFTSKITGALFFIYLVNTSGYADWMLDNYPKLTNSVIGLFGFFSANWLEDMVSRATKNFSLSIFRWKESTADRWIAIGAAIVLIPLFTISAVTSFSGVQGNINKGDLGLDVAQATISKIGTNGKGATNSQEDNLKDYLEMRNDMRKNIIANMDAQKKAASKECRKYHPDDKTARANCAELAAAGIDNDYAAKLDSFDAVTSATSEGKQATIDNTIAKVKKDNDKLTQLLYAQLDHKNAQIEWVGWIVGWIAMFFEAFALITALLVYGICYRCGASEKEMVLVGIENEQHEGAFHSIRKRIWNSFFGKRH